ncbi:MAG: ABC transporter substrate-binding protein [Deltaproteobacteria bacterium]|nr:MAG: ABC transporter substrate-binding protein [Deltaproteobacteria bacterium]
MKRILLLFCVSLAARAETNEIRAAQQYGLSYLALMLMEDGKIVEKRAQKLGLPKLKVSWAKLGGPQAMNDALLSGSLDVATGGVPSLITLWAKTKGREVEVRGVGALNDMPNELIVSRPEVKSIKDLGSQDKIAVPSVKISTQALLLEMAAAQEWGDANYQKLDPFTITMAHPDAMTALLSGSGAITGHYASPPFSVQEKAKPPLHAILSSYDTLGGQATFNVVWSTNRFHDGNPKAYQAFAEAFQEATDAINGDKRAAAATYKRMTKTAESIESLLRMMNDPKVVFTLEPHRILVTAEFMHRIGRIKLKPSGWKDLFFENVHGLNGS